MQFSVQLYSVRDFLKDDLPGTIQRLAQIGYTQVEAYDFVANVEALRAALRNNGLTAPSGQALLLDCDQDEAFAAAQAVGIDTVIEPYSPAKLWQNKDDVLEIAGKLNAAATKGAEYGIRVGYHNHAWEPASSFGDKSGLEFLADNLDPAVVLEVDTYWAAVGGQNPARLIDRLGDRVRFLHIKDGPITPDQAAQVPAGQGQMAVWDIIDAAKSLEFGVVEFDDYAGDLFDGVAQSLTYLRNGRV
ncbi:MAG TPA: sugar phosphate isomerase/epimerase [Microbacteriaceae bacterium]